MANFVWGSNGQMLTPEAAQRNRAIAEALMSKVQNPQTMWEGIQSAAGDIGGSLLNWQADQAEQKGRSAVADALAQAGQASDPQSAYLAVLGNDWASPQQSAVAQALLQRDWSQQDREAQWAHEADIQAQGWQHEDKQAQQQHDWQVNDPLHMGQAEQIGLQNEQMKKGYRPLVSPEDRAAAGIRPEDQTPYQVGPDGKLEPVGSGSGITINTGDNSSKFTNKVDELAAARMDNYVSEGNTAQQFLGDMQTLAEISKNLNTGKGADIMNALGPYAEMAGIDIKGLPEAQAFSAITSRLAPRMRAPGSGASSDKDVSMVLDSLPELGKTPEGNAIINQTLQAIQQSKIAAAEIASRAMSSPDDPTHITWQEADKLIRNIANPYGAFNTYRSNVGKGGEGGLATEGTVIENDKGDRLILKDGKWVPYNG